MEKEHKLLPAYLKQHKIGILLYVLTILIYSSVFSLYRLNFEIVGYGAVLCLFFALIAGVIDFKFYADRQIELRKCRNNITLSTENLPEPVDYTEEQYQILLKIMQADKIEKLFLMEQKKNDLIKHFTLWAHQVKTPIAAMSLLLEEMEEEYERRLEMDTELFKISQYVDMVLQYIRLGSSINDFIFREYDMERMIKQAVHKYAPMFIRKKLKVLYKPVSIRVVTDEKWLVFVLEQLLSNAIKYTNEGTISIYMEDQHDRVLVIEDTGIGILPEDLPRVFEAGYTGYNGRDHKKATGIGLYLCKEVIKNLGHQLWLESEPERGTRVMLDLSQNLR